MRHYGTGTKGRGEGVGGGRRVEGSELKRADAPKLNSMLKVSVSSVAKRKEFKESSSSCKRPVRSTSPLIYV